MRILYLDLDTLRPDHLGCYGYERDTSPNIDQIADEGVRFDNYYCSDAPCLPSRTALVTGQFGIHNGVVNHAGEAADLRIEGKNRDFRSRWTDESLPGFLREAGFNTVSFSPFAERHGSWPFYAGFNEMHNTGKYGMESAEDITPLVMKWIEDNGEEDDWFLHLNYWDAHTPYRAPEEFGNPFDEKPLPDWYSQELINQHRKLVGPHKPQEISMYDNEEDPAFPRHPGEIKDIKDLRRMIDGYDCGIKYLDQHIGRIFEALKEKGIFEDLVVIISADHAENLGELGIYGEHATADHATCRIPMIIRWPEGAENVVEKGLHYQLDLGPTLAELLGKEPPEIWDGQSYAPAVLEGKDSGRDSLVISQCAHVCQRSVRFGDWLYMRTYHDGYHLFPKEMLYNIKEDPYEEHNLADEHPELCRKAVYILNEWHDEMMMTMPDGYKTDPMWTVLNEGGPYHAKGHLPAYIEYLKKTDREYAIPELKRRHPGEFE